MRYLDEINFRSIEQVLFFDIETACGEEKLVKDTPTAVSWAYKMRKEKFKTFKQLSDSYEEQAPLYAPFGKIVCISVGYLHQGEVRKKSYTGTEVEILEAFFGDLSKLKNVEKATKKVFLCGFNVFAYDVPFVAFRAMVNKVRVDPWFDVAGMKQWNLKHIIDVSDLLKGTMFASMSLLNAVTAFGLPSPKEDIDGSQVSKAFYSGEIQRIAEYCERDVESTILLFNQIIN